ncbi:hypothetical protein L1987_62834 [Smallanthus sonchifolius]|uniref:Uncharacterized protein n=1 Tax=Smallanthus sonchifolius TaxID=185202 RepID=A0ACB9CBR9_9ASTR|nr:hypothetical protein L1987_62834 [Smallanthus sonchifolius]
MLETNSFIQSFTCNNSSEQTFCSSITPRRTLEFNMEAFSVAVSNNSKMEVEGLPLDRISNLPPNIIQTILTLMPNRDAFRTSILSQNWRDHCLNIPKLRFDDALFRGSAFEDKSIKCKLLLVVYPVVLRHQGPILSFYLCLSQLNSCCEIDQIILHLSRNATLKQFLLRISSGDQHKLLPAFFKLQQLVVLVLQNCAFQPPLTFNGFSKLVTLSFTNVSITAEVFLQFISNCPLLKYFTLIGSEKHLMGCWNSDFVELFKCLPLLEHLSMDWYPIQCFATASVVPQKLPTALVHLKLLHLHGLSFAREIDFRSALLLVTSSPNIEKIVMAEMKNNPIEAMSQSDMSLVDHQDYSCVTWDRLREMTITNFTNRKTGMRFVKLILAKAPMLKKVYIGIDMRVDSNGKVNMLKELIQYPRASASAEIMIN